MPSTQEFRRRIKSVSSTKQITKAMEMIASIKMQKATRTINQARSYIQNAWNLLHLLSQKALEADHPLIAGHPSTSLGAGKTAAIVITSDKGLCGSYNSEVIRKLTDFSNQLSAESKSPKSEVRSPNADFDIIAIGKVGASYINRYKIGKLIAEFKGFENNVTIEDVIPVSRLTNGEFIAGNYDRVVIIYSHFISSLKQVPVVKQILPIVEDHIDHPELWEKDNSRLQTTDNRLQPKNNNGRQSSVVGGPDYTFEPSPDVVFEGVLRQILRSQIFGAVLEAGASEHSARMVSMKNATDNATDLVDELTLIYNSIRQNNITSEIAEISGAAEAMK